MPMIPEAPRGPARWRPASHSVAGLAGRRRDSDQ